MKNKVHIQPKINLLFYFEIISNKLKKMKMKMKMKLKWTWNLSTMVVIFFFLTFLFLSAFTIWFTFWIDVPFKMKSTKIEIPLNCNKANLTGACPNITYPRRFDPKLLSSSTTCPDYFRWIDQDLRPWKDTGITRDMIEGGKKHADFRLVIIKGKAYVETYNKSFQTRDVFTIWGILQLLRLYPEVPDLELMFATGDKTVVNKSHYQQVNDTWPLPPVFHYCGSEDSLDIVFPDWSFWGWAETNIKPWTSMVKSIENKSKKLKWKDRVPYAFWKGNPNVSYIRQDLMKCNNTENNYWNVHLYNQDWEKESKRGFKHSKLENQCHYRYKIYVEGQSWSVSEKYILACDSMTLVINPTFYDFFSRSMVPMQHYWPIRSTNKCRDLKFAVEWGNNHSREAQTIGASGTKYIKENVSMKYVYDYMFHSLTEYSKLLKFKPKISSQTKEVCLEKMVCSRDGLWKKFMMESMVKYSNDQVPCSMPTPFDSQTLEDFLERKNRMSRQVEKWENEYREHKKYV